MENLMHKKFPDVPNFAPCSSVGPLYRCGCSFHQNKLGACS